ncbi:MAG TPA: ATP-binding protein [Opitutaceae bacterium]|nr:ATP-binding protein [Opitutaceae bacterium]
MKAGEKQAPGDERWARWRDSIIGLGEQSSRKSYYPELQRKLAELKESEAKLRAVFNSTHDAIIIHDFAGRLEDVNDPMLALFRVPRERAMEFTVADYSAPGAQRERVATVLEELRHSANDLLLEWRALRPLEGTEFDVEVALRRAMWGGREMCVAVVRDITERRRTETERRRLETELTQMRRMESIGRLAGGVAHDFNNMLTPILGFAELLRLDLAPDDPRRADLEQIVRSAERARELVRQLLAFARRQTFALAPIDLSETVRGIERMLRRVLRENITLTHELAPCSLVINGDNGQLEQVLMNLVVNAQDAMPEGGTLTIATEELSQGATNPALPRGPLAVLRVRDTGIGMDEATRARVFEPFFTTKETGRGTGLGLATVYGIVRQHEGEIEVRSTPGQGTEFSLYFPRLAAARPAAADAGPPAAPLPIPRGAGTLLVAEDQEEVRSLIVRVLGSIGYTVLAASSGEAAQRLAAAHAGPIDLLITDMVMPGQNGRELHRQLCEQRPDLKVLFMSGYASEALVDGCDVLAKPFKPADLANRVAALLANANAGATHGA